jgi:hypothetical protein
LRKIFLILILLAFLFSIFTISAKANENPPCLTENESPLCDDRNNYNGYWQFGFWIPGLPTFESQFLRMPDISSGSAVIYAPGVMLANAQYRGLSINGFVGEVATPFCSEIGHSVWLKRPNHDWEGKFLVVDCAKRNDLYGIIEFRDQVVEVDFDTAVRWGMAKYINMKDNTWEMLTGRLNNVILSKIPPDEIDNEPIDLSVWFLQNVTYAKQSEYRLQIQNYLPPENGIGLPSWKINGKWIIFK